MLWRNPLFFLVICLGFLGVALTLPLPVPIGPMYWDLYLYLDAAQRISFGQVPSVDFSTPIGPLSYYFYALMERLFPLAHPFFVAQWLYLPLMAPLMAVLVVHVAERSPLQAWLLLGPFLIFGILGFNLISVIPNTGVDAWGLYNRHATLVLYVLVAGLVFARSEPLRGAIILLTMLVLFFTKITAFLAGGLVLFIFFLAGRISLKIVAATVLGFLAVFGVLEVTLGLVSGYIADIYLLVTKNGPSMLRRFSAVAVQHFDLLGSCLALSLFLFVRERLGRLDAETFDNVPYYDNRFTEIFNRDWLLLLVMTLAALTFETQNAGGQPFVFLLPFAICLCFRVLRADFVSRHWMQLAIVVAAAFLITPPLSITLHKSARAFAAGVYFQQVPHENLQTLGRTSARGQFYQQADIMRENYVKYHEAFDAIVKEGGNAQYLIHMHLDFQLLSLQEIDKAITAIKKLEAESGRRFDTMWMLDFSTPLNWLMNRNAPKYVPIGADPTRTLQNLSDRKRLALEATDLILVPSCPFTASRRHLYDTFKPAFAKHKRIGLTRCMDALIRPVSD